MKQRGLRSAEEHENSRTRKTRDEPDLYANQIPEFDSKRLEIQLRKRGCLLGTQRQESVGPV